MLPYMTHLYGNPHSRTHAFGWEGEKAVEDAREVKTESNRTMTKNVFVRSFVESRQIDQRRSERNRFHQWRDRVEQHRGERRRTILPGEEETRHHHPNGSFVRSAFRSKSTKIRRLFPSGTQMCFGFDASFGKRRVQSDVSSGAEERFDRFESETRDERRVENLLRLFSRNWNRF